MISIKSQWKLQRQERNQKEIKHIPKYTLHSCKWIELVQVLWVSREEFGTTQNQEQEGDWKALVSQARGHTLGWLEHRFNS